MQEYYHRKLSLVIWL